MPINKGLLKTVKSCGATQYYMRIYYHGCVAAFTFAFCFSRLVQMLSICICFCLFSLDNRSWWTCSSFTFWATCPESPTVQSSVAQLISVCLSLCKSKSTKGQICLRNQNRTFVNSRGSYSKQCLCWSGYVVLLLGRPRIRPVMIMWNNSMSIDIITAEHVSLIGASGCVSCLKYTKMLLLWPLGRHLSQLGNWDLVSNYPKRQSSYR